MKLVEGEFTSAEEALRAQVLMMEAELKNKQENFDQLQLQYNELETKHKSLRASISWLTQELRELEGPYDEEQECTTSWPEVPSFGIYMQLLQALMGAKPPVVGGETDVTIAIKEQKYTE
jgi:hypothetical protein